jgi:hypothetical protein
MKKYIAIFLAGCICGAFVLGIVLALREFGQGMKSWGRTVAHSDIEVRQAIIKNGIKLPLPSWNLFYATEGFPDSCTWIALTVSRDELWNVIEASLHKKKEDFASGIPERFLKQVRISEGQEIDTSLWIPKSIKNPLHFSARRNDEGDTYFEDWVVDEEGGRVFITKCRT